ncbi:hypothetical protein BCR33DRAFT_717301 [Rhizoclosmatium globosum]|uniref:Uncharacterized protein n=1 Tax=Rhizoclosmatium globosum TaxID=329046 RepID=A0A1Y2C9T4_9FUNG|nr:hypothetical protein BCR33DRAFT_717301 [Rhizoclosmatium globosum]|eukprot:ORY43614.1 hypothetical protein BCR33DRAFT_717301 [Rhizoclosmatium globosum]
MPLAANEGDDDVSQEQIEKVESVLKEQEDKDVYLKEVQKLGHRVNHYKQDHIELTLAIFLVAILTFSHSCRISARSRLLLPGYYTWFDKDALHCTLRCL